MAIAVFVLLLTCVAEVQDFCAAFVVDGLSLRMKLEQKLLGRVSCVIVF